MPNIIAQPTPYTISSSPKAAVNITPKNAAPTIVSASQNQTTIRSSNPANTIKQPTSNSVQMASQRLALSLQVNTPNIQRGQVTGAIKSARFDRVGIYDYIGAALSANAKDVDAVWRIRRVRNDIPQSSTVENAGGANSYSFKWTGRLSVVYQ